MKEAVTNHDVKAVEYFVKEQITAIGLKWSEFVHFGLTSQDINNTGYAHRPSVTPLGRS